MSRSSTVALLVLALCCPVYVVAEPAITLPGEKDYGENCPYDAGDKNCVGQDCIAAPTKKTPA